jgi:hypothetical protein
VPYRFILWDLEDDPQGNVQHCLRHQLTKDDVEFVLTNPIDADFSRSSDLPVVFGITPSGRHILVVYEVIDRDTVYPVTAYDVP